MMHLWRNQPEARKPKDLLDSLLLEWIPGNHFSNKHSRDKSGISSAGSENAQNTREVQISKQKGEQRPQTAKIMH